ncbi:MarR family winged helix-turn-helix transcriptional regulator [Muricomes intestini]|uniref:MarR family transcriptional regulator n=2 Tax=Muricomes intestini TaxID=1796634 RepID=A0A4R3K6W8_9FIRM|nr:MarR family transcriptional regulator [Muricomes intestini]TCS78557.1 MarR family transcriptional regulator [Muricomes intestini]HAX52324.1 MarR family transcriptional regulator [Lachnospiraceae bacterium]HCR83347.1 MarR family transcriptional regulator [Lachnospiraceae bacterium]
MNAYETINDILVHLFNEIWELEEKAIITEEFKDISNNDMHIIEAVGLGSDSTMSMVARKLGITAGSLTTSVNSLVNKKYLVRERSESDRRVVYVRLTEKGRKAFFHHKDYHMQMTDAVVKSLDADEIPVLLKTLNSLSEFFRGYETKK